MVRTPFFHDDDTSSILVKNTNIHMSLIFVKGFIPEIFLSICILFQLLFNVTFIRNSVYNFPSIEKETFNQSYFVLLLVSFLLLNSKLQSVSCNSLLISNLSSNLVKIFIVFFSICSLSSILRGVLIQNLNFPEFFSVFMLSIFSALLLVSSHDFVTMYLLLEMQVLCYYILASFKRGSAFSTESGLKYFIIGSFFSCVFLLGCFLVYMCLGTLNFSNLTLLLSFPIIGQFLFIKYVSISGVMLIFITLLFKISCAPFHLWSPDVYEGSPLSSAVIFGVVSKIAAFHLIIKCVCIFSQLYYEFQHFFLVVGVLSVFTGTFFSIRQKRLKRLVVYSSIAQTGFAVVSLSTATTTSLISVYFFLIIYTITSLILWSYVVQFFCFHQKFSFFYQRQLSSIFLSTLLNYFKSNKVSATLLCLVFFSLAGIPPFCGFLAEIFIFHNLVNSGFMTVSLVLVLLSSVSAYYYVRVIKIIFFDRNLSNNLEQTVFHGTCANQQCSTSVMGVFSLVFFFFFPELLTLNCNILTQNMLGV